jgi:arsenate reductase
VLLEAQRRPFTLRPYLEAPPTREALAAVIQALGLTPQTFLRRKEDAFKTLSLAEASEDACLDAMVAHPVLIERPVLVAGQRAALGRPDTSALSALLDALAEESSP